MKVLIACEFTGTVRDAFRKRGHNAISCDIIPTEKEGPHYTCDVLAVLDKGWDMMIAFPPCTHLANSGSRWFPQKIKDSRQKEAIEFFKALLRAPIPKIAIENPIGIISSEIRKPDQIIQPYYFGDTEKKSTCLWLRRLWKLKPTRIVEPTMITTATGRVWSNFHSRIGKKGKYGRGHERSRTFQGIAEAMAEQWGNPSEYDPWRFISNG